ncbi:MAG TPA: hypothetical protein VJB35_01680 [Candidatus Nanoarchaeia archaeon]|nr:hypothetical protein [Candidatus Nanoarchaeia archaeon]
MENQTTDKATLVITYNSVENYEAGTYKGKNGPLVIYSHDNTRTWGSEEADNKLGQILHGLYNRINPEDVEKIYLYVGRYAKDNALRAAQRMAGQGNKLTLVACDCDNREKREVAKEIGVPIIWSECGGRRTLEEIVKKVLA